MISRVLITGANGQLGSSLRRISANYPNFEFTFTDVGELDITSRGAVSAMVGELQPQWVINAAAYTAVDRAEEDVELATLLNSTAVGILAEESAKVGAGLVHISTDYVFAGDNPKPLVECEPTNPISVYGVTKLQGEVEAQKNKKHIILRTSWLYSIFGSNFVKTMRRLGAERSEIGVVSDQWGSPTSAHDLAVAIMVSIQNPVYGVYHCSNRGETNWADFAQKIMEYSGFSCVVNRITTAQFPTLAKRPTYSLLSKEKFETTFCLSIPQWEDSLRVVISELRDAELGV